MIMRFPGGSVVKNLPANAEAVGDEGSIPGLGRSPGGGHGNPLQYSCLENPHGQRSLAGYSPRGRKELETAEATEHAHTHARGGYEHWLRVKQLWVCVLALPLTSCIAWINPLTS